MITNALKSLFFMLSIREQRLCLLLIFTCLFIWTKEQFKDFQLKAKNFEQVVVDLESQNLWKENEATIDNVDNVDNVDVANIVTLWILQIFEIL